MTAKKSAPREAARRSRGRSVSVVLSCPDAIKALKSLALRYGSQRAAIEAALIRLEKET